MKNANGQPLLDEYFRHYHFMKRLRLGRQIKIFRTSLNMTTREFSSWTGLSSGELSFVERGERPLSHKALSVFLSKFSSEYATKKFPISVDVITSNFEKVFYFEGYLRSVEELYKTAKHLPLSLRFAVFSYFNFMYEINERVPFFIELLSLHFLDKLDLDDVFSYLPKTNNRPDVISRLLFDTVLTRDFAYQMSFPVLCDFLSLLVFEISFNFYNDCTVAYFYDYVVDAPEFKNLALGISWSDNYKYEILSPPPPT